MTGPVRLAVLGDPLAYTLSPILHEQGLQSLGLTGGSRALRTPVAQLPARLDALAAAGYRGVNLTHPLKQAALENLDRVSDAARRACSVNTVSFEAGIRSGDTTDGAGFLDWLATLGRRASRERAVLLGAGGAARSLALALRDAGAGVSVAARRPAAAAAAWRGIGVDALLAWSSAALEETLASATLVVNATPLSDPEGLPAPRVLPRRAAIVDLNYGPGVTAWVLMARAEGLEAYDGLGMLVAQARRSLALWLGVPPPFQALARAVGWPR